MTVVPLVRLQEVCVQDRKSVRPGECRDLRYIGLETVEANTGTFIDGELSKTPEAPQANSFRFGKRHVLYGKLRPYLNKVVLPEFEGKCSTEIIPLLPTAEIDRAYLAHFLRSPQIVSLITAKTAGSRMPRADMDFVLSLQIPLSPLPEQRRIVDILSRTEGIVRLQKQAVEKAREIIPALFLDMFGDPSTNPKGWPTGTIGDVLTDCDYGTSTKASSDGLGCPMLRMANVSANGDLDLTKLKRVELSHSERKKYSLKAGDLLFNRTNSKELVGKTGLWDGRFEAVAASYFIRLRVNRNLVVPEYLCAFLNTRYMKRFLFETARGAIGQANINAREVRSFTLLIPPLRPQKAFGERIDQIRSTQTESGRAVIAAEALFQSLLHRAFGG